MHLSSILRKPKSSKAILVGRSSSSLMVFGEIGRATGLLNCCYTHEHAFDSKSSQFCSQLASSGKVVLAVEHRDGTGIFCMPCAWEKDGRSRPRDLFYLKESDVT